MAAHGHLVRPDPAGYWHPERCSATCTNRTEGVISAREAFGAALPGPCSTTAMPPTAPVRSRAWRTTAGELRPLAAQGRLLFL